MSGITLTGSITGSGTLTLGGTIATLNQNTTGSSGSCTGNAATATTAAACSGNAATATVAASCSGNAATATTAAACSGNAATATVAGAITGQANSATITAVSINTANNIVMRDGNGDFNAGTVNTTNVSATGYIQAGNFNAVSSLRYKDNVVTLLGASNLVKQLRGVSYDRKDGSVKNDVGVIAEEVQQLIPAIVGLNSEGAADSVDYGRLSAVLIEAVKDILARLEKLESK